MDPIKLSLENFCSHSNSEIDFSDFSTALIVGKIRGSDKYSNGAGKSTLFAAIKYVLFNEIEYSSLDKVVRHNTDYCRVTFEFKGSDQEIYKIIRSKSKKSGSDIRLFKKNQEDWDDLTQRRITDTEKEIEKIIKTNYKTFCNSFIFSQSDFSGIASITPEKRKTALKEVLQLNIYSKFESLAKKKIQDIVKEIEKKKVIISTLGSPDTDISVIDLELNIAISLLKEKEAALEATNKNIEKHNLMLSGFQTEERDIEHKSLANSSSIKELGAKLLKINNSIFEYTNKLNVSRDTGKLSLAALNTIQDLLTANSKIKVREINIINEELESIRSAIMNNKAKLETINLKIEELSLPLPKDSVCKHCRQALSDEHRQICQSKIPQEITIYIDQKTALTQELIMSLSREKKIFEELDYSKNLIFDLKRLTESAANKQKEIEEKRVLYMEYSHSLNKLQIEKNETTAVIESINQNSSQESIQKLQDIKNNIVSYKIILDKFKHIINTTNKEILVLSNTVAVLQNTKNKKEQDINSIKTLLEELSKYEEKYSIHQQVSQAFSSIGIPALIIHNILDDLQIEANNLISEIRSGLQMQFVIIKDRNNGEQEDTLDIVYMLNGFSVEYAQLSSAQKLIVSLGLKLGLASVLKKRLGVDIKLLLIDEADQSLDEAGIEAFEDCIKKLQKDYKILIITHNTSLKDKFSHIIVVEQDEECVSTAKLVNAW